MSVLLISLSHDNPLPTIGAENLNNNDHIVTRYKSQTVFLRVKFRVFNITHVHHN